MLYYAPVDILKGLAYSFALGVLLNFAVLIIDVFFDFFDSLRIIPKEVIIFSKNRKKALEYLKRKIKHQRNENKGIQFLKDMLFSCICAFLLTILFYISNDGEIRIYVLLTALFSFLLCKKLLGKPASRAVICFFGMLVKIIGILLIFLILPLRFAANKALGGAIRARGKMRDTFRKRERGALREKNKTAVVQISQK